MPIQLITSAAFFVRRASDETAGGDKRSTAGSPYDTVAKPDNLFTAGSYSGLAAKAIITAGYLTRMGPPGHEPAVIRTTAGCLKTVGESPCGE